MRFVKLAPLLVERKRSTVLAKIVFGSVGETVMPESYHICEPAPPQPEKLAGVPVCVHVVPPSVDL